MTKSTTVWALSTVPDLVPWLTTLGWFAASPAVVELVEESGGLVVDVVVDEVTEGAASVDAVFFGCFAGTEKQAQSSPATCSRCTALSKLRPVTLGTTDPLGKQPDHVIPIGERAGRAVPGASAVAPMRASVPGPGTERADTTLSLAVVAL